MPVDPIIIATTDFPFSDEAVSKLNADMIDQIGDNFSGPNGCAISNLREDEYWGQDNPEHLVLQNICLICHTDMPYYGRGYERGSWPELAAIIEMLRRRIPESSIWYGNDTSESVQSIDANWLDEMWTYWCLHGRRPYSDRLGRTSAG